MVWTTQRLDEIRGFADTVTVLDRGERIRVVYSGRNHFYHEKIALTFEVPATAPSKPITQK